MDRMTPHTPVEGLAAEIREVASSTHTLTNDDLRDTLLAWADRLASLPVEGWKVELVDVTLPCEAGRGSDHEFVQTCLACGAIREWAPKESNDG